MSNTKKLTLGKVAVNTDRALVGRGKDSELTQADLDALLGKREWAQDARRITVGRLFYVDLPKAVARYSKGFTKDERESLRTDALLWITERASHGVESFPLGAPGQLPMRKDWLEDGQPTKGAWRAMHAALKAAADAPARLGLAPKAELPIDGETLGQMAEREMRAQEVEDRSAVMIDASAYDLTRALGLPENAARALLASAFSMSLDECAEEWGVTRETASVAISKGRRILAGRYPEPYDLLEALRAGVIALSAIREDRARQTILEWVRHPNAQGWLEADALQAAREWQSGKRELPPQRAALISALVRALVADGETDSEKVAERAQRLADSITRLLVAEKRRAYLKPHMPGTHGSVDMASDAPLLGPAEWKGDVEKDERKKASESLARRAEDRAIANARRAYFRHHPIDWDYGADLLTWYGKPSENGHTEKSMVPAPMYETDAWAKGMKL